MTNEKIREHCLGLPHVTEVVQWEDHLLFKVAGKMFAMIELDGHRCSLRCSPEKYAELLELPDIVPSSHNMWKYHWVTTETLSALPDREFRELLTESYQIVRARLPKRILAGLDGAGSPAAEPSAATKRSRAKRAGRKPG